MNDSPLLWTEPKPRNSEKLVVRFPAPACLRQPQSAWTGWKGLLPRRWRRQVVINGRRFWLPG